MRNITPGTVDWKRLAVPVVLAAAVLCALGSYFTVSAGNVAVKLRFGKIVGAYGEGLHFKLPLVDTIEKFSVRIKKDSFTTEAFS